MLASARSTHDAHLDVFSLGDYLLKLQWSIGLCQILDPSDKSFPGRMPAESCRRVT